VPLWFKSNERVVVVDLDDEDYQQLIIEVADPDAIVKLLTPS